MSKSPTDRELSAYLDGVGDQQRIHAYVEGSLRSQTLLAFWSKLEEYVRNLEPVSVPSSERSSAPDAKFVKSEPRLTALEARLQTVERLLGKEGFTIAQESSEQERIAKMEKSFDAVELLLQRWQKTGKIPKVGAATIAPGVTLRGSYDEKYLIEKIIVKKEDGCLYLARQDSTGDTVVVKAVPNLANDEAVVRCIMEGRILVGLDHPNIVKGLDYVLNRNRCFMVMEYIVGETLERVVRRLERIDAANACRLILQVAQALQYLDRYELVHRDIKPSNIVVTKEERIKLIDFGIAKTELNITQEGIILGTPYFLSPEQIQGTKVDIMSDIFSLGSTFYFMVTGVIPFQGERALDIMSSILRTTPKKPRKIADVPKAVSDIIEDMMRKNPKKRPTLDKLIQRLQAQIKEN